MKSKMKKALAFVCCLAMGISAMVVGIPAAADGEYFTITDSNRNLFVNVGQEIELVDISVTVNGVALSGADVAWTSTNDKVSVLNGVLKVSAKGSYTLTVEDANQNTGTVTVWAKNPTETEWVLYEEDFEDVADGALPDGWTIAVNRDVAADPATGLATCPTYVEQPMVKDGVFYIGNGINTDYNYVWLPESLDGYEDYSFEVSFKQSWIFNNARLGGIVMRGDRTLASNGVHPVGGYRIYMNRGNGLRLTSLARIDNAENKTDATLPFRMGSTRGDWSRPDQTSVHPMHTPKAPDGDPDWKACGYNVVATGTVSGSTVKLDAYRDGVQEQFGGDMGPGGGGAWWDTYWLADDEGLVGPELEKDTSTWADGDKRTAGAIGLFSAGVQMAVEKVRVVVKASELAGNPDTYIPHSEQEAAKNTVYTAQKFGVVSDIHLQLQKTDGDYNLKALLTKFKNEGVSAVLVNGDVINTGAAAEYEVFNKIWDSVFPNAATAPELLAITGNHEFEQAYYNRETVDDVYDHYMEAYGYDEVNFHKVINGVHIIGVNSEGAAVNGNYTLDTVAYLEAELEAAVEADPYAPIIVMCHQTLAGTTYGSGWGSGSTGALYEVLKPYQQVVYLAGHSHFPTENERSIMQKDFTCVDLPSVQYTSVETAADGTGSAAADNAFMSQGGMLITIDATDKQMELQRLKISGKYDAATVVDLKDPWIIKLPTFKREFTYTAERADNRVAPTFPADAAVAVGEITNDACVITFPSASHDDFVQGYNVKVTEKGGDGSALLTKYFVADFYLGIDKMKTEQTVELTGLPSNTEFVVEITAIESFGKTSAPITGEGKTEPITTPADGLNYADFFDVNTAVGFQDNSPYRRNYNVYVKSHPIKFVQDEELDRQVAYMGGWVNYAVSQGQLKKITEAFTIDLAFKSPSADWFGEGKVGQCLFGNPESGGITVEYTGAGAFQVGAHIGGGYKYIKAPELAADTWYQMTYTFDGEKSVLYINGVKVGEVASVGTVHFHPEVNFLTIGANVNKAGNAAYVFYGDVAHARVYTDAKDAAFAAAAYKAFTNDNAYNAVYQSALKLYYVDTTDMAAADVAKIQAIINEAEGLLNNANLTEKAAAAYVAKATDLLKALAAEDPTIAWGLLEDNFDDFTKITDKSAAGLQWEGNKEIKDNLISKNANVDIYVMYELPGYVRAVELDALSVATEFDFDADFKFFVSEDGETWREMHYGYTEPADNAYNAYWVETTASPKGYIGGEYKYVKIQLNEFGLNSEDIQRVNWSTVLSAARIWYSADADDIAMDESIFTDYVAPEVPEEDEKPSVDEDEKPEEDDDKKPVVKPEDDEKPSDDEDDKKPSADKEDDKVEEKPDAPSAPAGGESLLGYVLALIVMAGSALSLFFLNKKRVRN